MCSAPLTVIETCRTAASFRPQKDWWRAYASRPVVPNAGSRPRQPSSAPRLQRSLHVSVGLALRDVAALVSTFLAPGQRELDLRPPVLEVELRRNERQTPLGDLAGEGVDFFPVEEELAVAIRIMIGEIALVVDRDVGADQPGSPLADIRVGLRERGPAVPKGLPLCAGQHDPRLDPLEQVIVVARSADVDAQRLALLTDSARR